MLQWAIINMLETNEKRVSAKKVSEKKQKTNEEWNGTFKTEKYNSWNKILTHKTGSIAE